MWVNTEDFARWKIKIGNNCDEQLLEEYIVFLKKYNGGFVKRRNGEIIFQDFLGKEKGDLKGIFFNVIVPSRHISVKAKEEFRTYLCSIGVKGLDKRPEYEMRSGKLKADPDKEEYHRKVVGNRGEKKMREALSKLDINQYFFVNGVVLRINGREKEFDHIVIKDNAMFVLETKAFGMAEMENGSDKAELYIDKNDSWTMKKFGKIRKLNSPTQQIQEQKSFIQEFTSEMLTDVKYILVLSNSQLKVRKGREFDYEILSVDETIQYIENYKGIMSISDKFQLISKIEQDRVN